MVCGQGLYIMASATLFQTLFIRNPHPLYFVGVYLDQEARKSFPLYCAGIFSMVDDGFRLWKASC